MEYFDTESAQAIVDEEAKLFEEFKKEFFGPGIDEAMKAVAEWRKLVLARPLIDKARKAKQFLQEEEQMTRHSKMNHWLKANHTSDIVGIITK